jgi:hypothetical protein
MPIRGRRLKDISDVLKTRPVKYVIIIIIILQQLGLTRPAASSNIFLKALPTRRRPFGPQFSVTSSRCTCANCKFSSVSNGRARVLLDNYTDMWHRHMTGSKANITASATVTVLCERNYMKPPGDFGIFASVRKTQRRVHLTDCGQFQCDENIWPFKD